MHRRSIVLILGLTLVAVAGGCEKGPPPGPPLAEAQPVHGKVTFKDGMPLRGGLVTFTPTEVVAGRRVRYEAAGLVDGQGNYKVGLNGNGAGAPEGDYKVTVAPRETQELPGSNVSRIPKQYQETSATPLKATIKAGDNTFDFRLE
jgi:hypothetical protein